jgi:D-aminopeptidase
MNEAGSGGKVTVRVDEKAINELFRELDRCDLPGAAVGIAINGRPVYRRGFGLASMELPVLLAPTTRMRIGSSTKQFAAFAYMLLCEEGRAAIDDTIGAYLPELHPVAHRITMRQLMTNTSGLRDAIQISWEFSGMGRRVSAAELLSLYRDIDDVNAPAGTAWLYINGGWLILSMVIERITGQPFEEVLREWIFTPIGMHDTLLRRWDTDFVPHSATLHMSAAGGGYERSYLGTALTGEGGIVSTVDDMLRWLAHMDDPIVGTQQTWETMKRPLTLPNGMSTGYSLGLMIGKYRGTDIVHHGGSVMGGMTQMLKVPSAKLDVTIITNRWDANPVALTSRVLDTCLVGLDEPKTRKAGPVVTGVFRSPKTGRIIEMLVGSSASYLTKEGMQAVSIDGLEIPVEPDEAGVLWPAEGLGWMKLSITLIGNSDRPDALKLSDFGNVDWLERVAPTDGPDTRSLAGRFRSSTTDTDAVVTPSDSGLQLRIIGRFGSVDYRLRRLTPGIWRAKARLDFPPGFILSFQDDALGFEFWSYRTVALPFRRVV